MRYLAIIEETESGFSAYAPDLPGCVSAGATRDEVEANMREAIELHLEGLRADGDEIPQPRAASPAPEPRSSLVYLDVAA